MILGRLLMRFLLVPLGGSVAILAFVLFVVVAQWNRFSALIAAEANPNDEFAVALFLVGSWVVAMSAFSAGAMLLPALLGALIAEAFAIRSWMFHAANGTLSAWIGWTVMNGMHKPYEFYGDPLIVIGAGIASGFAYWAVAGWSAGFWKPVFAPQVSNGPPTPAAQA
jgi:hypothetical protein